MSRHQTDLIMCMNQAGTVLGLQCEKCEGRCPNCDSDSHPQSPVRICHTCSTGRASGLCIICGLPGNLTAYYCVECCKRGKDRDGCPRIINLGSNRLNLYYEKKNIENRP